MENRELTKAEEQVMLHLWNLNKGFLADIVETFPEPRPAYTTIATVIRVLVKKGFIGFTAYGKSNEYFPVVSKDQYFKGKARNILTNFYHSSPSKLVSFFATDESLSIEQLEEIRKLIDERIENFKKKES